jgi:osmotically-inducible protein OsmY
MFNFFQKTDSQIQKDVMHELKWDPRFSMDGITASTQDGIVTLRGSVPHFYDKISAESAAQRVGGVRAVTDEIVVDVLGPHAKSDQELAEAVVNALTWSYSVPDGIKVSVEKGWITLSGLVEWEFERHAASAAVSNLLGVKGLKNDIAINSLVSAADIQEQIEAALKRSAEIEGRKITVAVVGNRVTLTGEVHSFSEIADAGLAAWNAPGVATVENNLKLRH